MRESSKKILRIVLIVLVIAAIAAMVFCFIKGGITGWFWPLDITQLISLCFAMIYMFKGFGKDAANMYRWFMSLFAIGEFFRVLAFVLMTTPDAFLTILRLVDFGIIAILANALDLGKLKSKILGLVLLLVEFGMFMFAFVGGGKSYIVGILGQGCDFVLAAIANVMIFAKYADKDSRGTK